MSCRCPGLYSAPQSVGVDLGPIGTGEAFDVAVMAVRDAIIPLHDLPEGIRPLVFESAPVIPMMIYRLMLAQNSSRDGQVRVSGFIPEAIILSGVVEMVQQFPGFDVRVRLNDATGRLFITMPPEVWGSLPGQVIGRYLLVCGRLVRMWSTESWEFVARVTKILTTPDEISYHVVESAHAHLAVQRERDYLDIADTEVVNEGPMAVERRPVVYGHASGSAAWETVVGKGKGKGRKA